MDVLITLLLAQGFASTLLQAETIDVRDANVTITSPSFPRDYPPNSSVEWRVYHSSPVNFTFNFTHFSLERSEGCKFDSFRIENKPYYLFMGPLCGNLSAKSRSAILELSYGFILRFKSDSSDQSQGFSLNITTSTIPHRQLCDYMHDPQKRRFRSRIGKAGDTYPADLNCSWVISGQPNKQIVLQFDQLDVEFSGPNCLYDRVEVWDIQKKGISPVDTRLAKACGRHNPWELYTNSSKIRLKFFSDGSDNTGVFVIGYNSSAALTYISSRTKNTYVTPFPQTLGIFADGIQHRLPVRLIWKFRTHPGYSIQVQMKTLSTRDVSLYDGPDKSFQKVKINQNQSVVSSVGFHFIVAVDLNADVRGNITFICQHRMSGTPIGLATRSSNWYRILVNEVCGKHAICQSSRIHESFMERSPNIDNCAYAGLAVYGGDVLFDKLIGTFCNIYRGYLETFFRNLVVSTKSFHMVYYTYERARATQFVSVYYRMLVMYSYPCRGYVLIHKQNQFYKAQSFTLKATFGDGQYNISIKYTDYEFDCFRVQVVPYLTPLKQINLLLKGNFRYRICRQGGLAPSLEMASDGVSSKHDFKKRCSRYNMRYGGTETALTVNTDGWPLEYILIELSTLPVGHKDIVEMDFHPERKILHLEEIYRYRFRYQLSLRFVLPHNNLTMGYYCVGIAIWDFRVFGNTGSMKISEESGQMEILWSTTFKYPTIYYQSMQGAGVVVYLELTSFLMEVQALQLTRRPLRVANTPAAERCVLFEDHCYTLKQAVPPTSWRASRAACLDSGGDLVSVNSWGELNFLKEALSSIWFDDFYGKRRGVIFIGLNDVTKANVYRWVDGSPLAVSDWYQPFNSDLVLPDSPRPPIDRDYIQPMVNRSQRCVAMVPGNSFSSTNWRKIECGPSTYPTLVYGICEHNNRFFLSDGNESKAATNRDENVKYRCETGWHFVHNTCVIVLNDPKKGVREETERLCTSYGGRLPETDTIRKSESLLLSLGFSTVIGSTITVWVQLESGEVACLAVYWGTQSRSFTYGNCKQGSRDLAICERDPVEINMNCLHYQFSCEDGTCLNPDRICDLHTDCSHGEDESNCNLPGYLFTCDSGEQISVFKFCDFLVDCLDGSDEDLCIHKSCSAFQFECDNKQCIEMDQRCDQKPDCIDDSDEADCDWEVDCHGFRCPLAGCVVNSHVDDIQPDCLDYSEADEKRKYVSVYLRIQGYRRCSMEGNNFIRCHRYHSKCYPADSVCVYDHDVYGRVKYCSDGAHLRHCREHECPDMFKCPQSYCIPYHKVCDGVQDCVRGEDESNCGDNTCPGMLKCGSTNQCIPHQNICDKEVNCKYDWSDEKFCDLKNYSCPLNCTCVGYYVDCRNNQLQNVFDISLMKAVRVLNLAENNISFLGDLDLGYLTVVYLQHNSIQNLSSPAIVTVNNLIYLDISFNRIEVIPDETLSGLSRLHTLRMVGNPVHQLAEDCFRNLNFLRTLNLSGMLLEELGPNRFVHLNSLKSLDLSNNSIRQLSPKAFASLPPLDVLLLHDNLLNLSTPDALQNLDVRLLRVDSFRFCCAARPIVRTCVAPEKDAQVENFSSCDDLLLTDVIRVAVGVFAILAILGNVFVISWRLYKRLPDVPSVFIFHLSLSDLLTGLYLLTISIADLYYHGVYILHDLKWRASVYCKLIGVIGFISCEMSMYTLVFIAVDRTKKLAFPLSSGQLTVTQAWIIQLVGWAFWTCLGVCPLILPAYFGDYYGRNSICLPFNFADPKGPGWEMTTAIFVGFNTIGLIMIIAMYALIVAKVKESQKRSGRRDRIEVDIARKLSIVIVTDVACMLPIVLANFTAVIGQPIDRSMASIIGNLLLPLNSALNPYLFTLNNVKIPTTCTRSRK